MICFCFADFKSPCSGYLIYNVTPCAFHINMFLCACELCGLGFPISLICSHKINIEQTSLFLNVVESTSSPWLTPVSLQVIISLGNTSVTAGYPLLGLRLCHCRLACPWLRHLSLQLSLPLATASAIAGYPPLGKRLCYCRLASLCLTPLSLQVILPLGNASVAAG